MKPAQPGILQTRRDFLRTTTIAGAGLALNFPLQDCFAGIGAGPQSPLYTMSGSLVEQWAKKLLELQVTDRSRTDDYGGIWCPANQLVHGRVGDTIYPFCYMASQTRDSRYLDASVLLYRWIERRVSQDDGSWLNEPVKGSWKGTTVFTIIALGETLKNHGTLLDPAFKQELEARLKKAGDYVYNTFNIDYGNINYPISASYALCLLDTLLDVPKFREKGRELAHQSLNFITAKDHFIKGEGQPYYEPSKKGCFSVDLGYNVEESLPSLVLYGLLTKDEEVLSAVTRSLQTHLEFMLPDGGWDNSWGTRNYKWTYWGSRTSDGCQPAYALLADRDPRFYRAALKNTELLKACTQNGLLYGGPHYVSHGVPASVHHTFCHIKALTTILDHHKGHENATVASSRLPREEAYGSRFFSDIQTALVATGKFRATVTGYDREYKPNQNGHATGGGLTLLWHEVAGPLFTASMNDYQLIESGNMQADTDPLSMCLTPRIELQSGGGVYRNISDLNARIAIRKDGNATVIDTWSKLVDKAQQDPPAGPVACKVTYRFTDQKITITFSHDQQAGKETVRAIFPVISRSGEKISAVSAQILKVYKPSSVVTVSADRPIIQLPVTKGRVFNFVPGLEAIPLAAEGNVTIELAVT